jgi:phage shock protein PspC (stress-responsive transcriptional regulator)
MAVFCHRCGSGLPMSARFCSSCGAVIPVAANFPGQPLVRPRMGRAIAGVCLALARTNGWDVGAVRVLTVLAFFFSGGIVAVAYLAGWIGIPEEPLVLSGMYPPPAGSYPPAPGTYPPSSGAYPPS